MNRRKTVAAIVTLLFAGLPHGVRAQIDCSTFPPGPSRTDCYINVSRSAGLQTEIAAGKVRVQSDAAHYRQITGTEILKPAKHRQPKAVSQRAPE